MELDPKGLEAAMTAYGLDVVVDGLEAAIRAYLEAAPSPSPAPVVVTDAMVTKALSAFEKDHPHNRAAMRAALTAAVDRANLLAVIADIRISMRDPMTIIAGIKQFGLASDGSDLRDLEAAIGRLSQPADERVVEALPIADRLAADNARLREAIERALQSLCGDYPSMAADLRAALEASNG